MHVRALKGINKCFFFFSNVDEHLSMLGFFVGIKNDARGQ